MSDERCPDTGDSQKKLYYPSLIVCYEKILDPIEATSLEDAFDQVKRRFDEKQHEDEEKGELYEVRVAMELASEVIY